MSNTWKEDDFSFNHPLSTKYQRCSGWAVFVNNKKKKHNEIKSLFVNELKLTMANCKVKRRRRKKNMMNWIIAFYFYYKQKVYASPSISL